MESAGVLAQLSLNSSGYAVGLESASSSASSSSSMYGPHSPRKSGRSVRKLDFLEGGYDEELEDGEGDGGGVGDGSSQYHSSGSDSGSGGVRSSARSEGRSEKPRTDAGTSASNVNKTGYYYKAVYGYKSVMSPSKAIAAMRNTEYAPRDWNADFQLIMDSINRLRLRNPDNTTELFESYKKLDSLSTDFLKVAKLYGKLIITEYCLPVGHKTIKPARNIGGIAGGEKYIVGGILFKFAADVHRLYGADEGCMKAAGNELKGLVAFYNAVHGYDAEDDDTSTEDMEELNFPLITLIDWRGFRLIAMSILPIDHSTLIYGSNNGGLTVKNSSASFSSAVARYAQRLYLKPHRAGLSRHQKESVMLSTPTDIEGHRGLDGRGYLLDFSRLFPPQFPRRSTMDNRKRILYELLRPELLRAYGKPLSADALSKFGSANAELHNREVEEATAFLYDTQIPKVSRALCDLTPAQLKRMHLSEMLHRHGVNVRHLGIVRKLSIESKAVSAFLLRECIARTVKCMLRKALRQVMKEVRYPSEEPFRQATVSFLNRLISPMDPMWYKELKLQILAKFGSECLTDVEKPPSYNLRDSIGSVAQLFEAIFTQTNIRLTDSVLDYVMGRKSAEDCRQFRLFYTDIDKISVRVKHPGYVSYAQAQSLFQSQRSFTHSPQSGDRLFRLANQKFHDAIKSSPDDRRAIVSWCKALQSQFEIVSDWEEKLRLVEQAIEKFESIRDWSGMSDLVGVVVSAMLDSSPNLEYARQRVIMQCAYQMLRTVHANTGDVKVLQRLARYQLLETRLCSRKHMLGKLFKQCAEAYKAAMEEAATQLPNSLKPSEVALIGSIVSRAGGAAAELERLETLPMAEWAVTDAVLRLLTKWHAGTLQIINVRHSRCELRDFSVPLPALVELNINGCASVSAAALIAALQCTPALQRLRARKAQLSIGAAGGDEAAQAAELPLVALPALHSVDLSDSGAVGDVVWSCCNAATQLRELSLNNCTSVPFSVLLRVVEVCNSGLHKLELSSWSIPKSGTEWLASCGGLRTLNLAGARNVTKSVLQEIGKLRHLAQLNLDGIADAPDATLRQILASNTELEKVQLRKCRLLSPTAFGALQSGQLRSLEVSGCMQLSSEALRSVLLRCAPTLQKLDMSSLYKLSGDMFEGASVAFTALQSLNVAHCENLSLPILAQLCGPNLTSLNLNNSRVTDAMLAALGRQCPKLEVLSVFHCQALKTGGLEAVASQCTRLRSLSVGNSRINNDILRLLATRCALEEVVLNDCRYISDAGLMAVFESARRLTKLNLCNCTRISNEALLHLAKFGSVACHLQELKLSGLSKISDVSVLALAEIWMPRLQAVAFSRCYHVTDMSIIKLAKCAPGLEDVELSGMKGVTLASIAELKTHCKKIKTLLSDVSAP